MATTTALANRIFILGAGNLGQYIARGLARQSPQQPPVTLLFHRSGLLNDWKSAGEAIECEMDGRTDRTGGIDVEILVPGAGSGVHEPPPIKNLIVACKTYLTVPALEQVKSRLDRDSTIVFLQNGMGTTEEVTKELFPSAGSRPALWAGVCVLGVSSTKPFSITPTGRGHITLGPVTDSSAGSSSGSHSPSNLMIQHLLQTDDPVSALATPGELRRAQLLKLVANAIINPLTATLGCKNGQLLDEDSTVALIKVLIEEAGPVVRALLPPSQSETDVAAFSDETLLEYVLMVAQKTAGNISSMLQDVRNGKRTEIDYINGFIVAQGVAADRPCPNHAILVDMVRKGDSMNPGNISGRFELK